MGALPGEAAWGQAGAAALGFALLGAGQAAFALPGGVRLALPVEAEPCREQDCDVWCRDPAVQDPRVLPFVYATGRVALPVLSPRCPNRSFREGAHAPDKKTPPLGMQPGSGWQQAAKVFFGFAAVVPAYFVLIWSDGLLFASRFQKHFSPPPLPCNGKRGAVYCET